MITILYLQSSARFIAQRFSKS